MALFKLTAESVSYLEKVVEAKNRDEAWEILENTLNNGEMQEIEGEIRNHDIEELF